MRASPALSIVVPRWRIATLRVSATAICVAGLTLLALSLRLTWVLYTQTTPLGGDPHWYYTVGINLARGYGFVAARNQIFEIPGPGAPTAFWPPGYPLALAAVFKVFGVSVTSAKVLNATLGAFTVPLVYGLGSALFQRRVGLLAAALFAVFPNVIASEALLFPEPLFTLLFIAALWLLVAEPIGRGWTALAAFGVLTALATLTRGQGVVLVPLALSYWVACYGWRSAARSTALATLAAVAAIAPWTVRNAVEMHAFIPVSTNAGAVLRIGHEPGSTGMTQWTQDKVGGFSMWQSLYRPDWEVQGYHAYTRLAIQYALTHPKQEIRLSSLKLYHVYATDAGVIPWLTTLGTTPLRPASLADILWQVFNISYYALFFAALASVPLWLRRDPRRVLLAAVFGFWSLFHIVFVGDPRYHVPLYPLFFIAVAGGLSIAFDGVRATFARWAERRATAPAPFVAQPTVRDAEPAV